MGDAEQGAGLALAFLIEMLLDRSLRRPMEIEAKLGLPVFISIPDFNRNGQLRAKKMAGKDLLLLTETARPGAGGNLALALTPWSRQSRLRPFCDGLRDRLIVHFEIKNVTHKPKLVAVTSCGRGAGPRRRTSATVRQLRDRERAEELARMLGGEAVTSEARANARRLLAAARP